MPEPRSAKPSTSMYRTFAATRFRRRRRSAGRESTFRTARPDRARVFVPAASPADRPIPADLPISADGPPAKSRHLRSALALLPDLSNLASTQPKADADPTPMTVHFLTKS